MNGFAGFSIFAATLAAMNLAIVGGLWWLTVRKRTLHAMALSHSDPHPSASSG